MTRKLFWCGNHPSVLKGMWHAVFDVFSNRELQYQAIAVRSSHDSLSLCERSFLFIITLAARVGSKLTQKNNFLRENILVLFRESYLNSKNTQLGFGSRSRAIGFPPHISPSRASSKEQFNSKYLEMAADVTPAEQR